MKIYSPFDTLRSQGKYLEDSNDVFQKHMNEYWKEKRKKENNRFRLTTIIAILGLVLAIISVIIYCR